MRNVSDTSCTENENTHFMFNKFLSENLAVYEIMWKNMLEPDRLQVKIQSRAEKLRFPCRINKARIDTHT